MSIVYTIEDGTPLKADDKIIRESLTSTAQTLMNYTDDKRKYLKMKERIERNIIELNDLTDKWRTIKSATGIDINVPANKTLTST